MNRHFIEPWDVLFLRGNKLFGDPGSYGEALVPPWPSVAAGAIRSAILVRDGIDPARFATGQQPHKTLGTPEKPGTFTVHAFTLARQTDGRTEALYAPPADLVISKADDESLVVQRLTPHRPARGIDCSLPTEQLPVLTQAGRSKPASGWWLTEAGYATYLKGGEIMTPDKGKKKSEHMIHADQLWAMDERVGVGLEPARRRAEDGRLFTVQAVAFRKGVGFLAATEGDGFEQETLLRFGGDGRAARCRNVDYRPPAVDLEAICEAGCCRIVLTTPGIFPEGWRPPGMAADGSFELMGVKGRVVAAAVGRAEVISGWDLARWQPKSARRAVPTGSVYWLEDLQATPDTLAKLGSHGLWPETSYDAQRKAEGFNRFDIGMY